MKIENVETFIFGMCAGLLLAVVIQAIANRPTKQAELIDGVVCVKVIPNRVASIVTVPCK